MKLFIVGLNHKTAPVEIRERLSFGSHDIIEVNAILKERIDLEEGLILSTCNRVEVYAVTDFSDDDCPIRIKNFLAQNCDISLKDFDELMYVYEDSEAVSHLFNVASGLDSMVIGETEILGQVKKAYQDARQSKATGKVLNRLLEKTFKTAKMVRTDTSIAQGLVSVSSVTLRLAAKILGDLVDKKVLIVGAGGIGEQLILYFKDSGVESVYITNRTFEKADMIANTFNAKAVRFEDFKAMLPDIDIVIASTGAPHRIILKQEIMEMMPKRKQKPFFIIDLAVPRDVDAEVNEIDNVYLYDIDDLQSISDQNIALRRNELVHCQKIIEASCQRFVEWIKSENELGVF